MALLIQGSGLVRTVGQRRVASGHSDIEMHSRSQTNAWVQSTVRFERPAELAGSQALSARAK